MIVNPIPGHGPLRSCKLALIGQALGKDEPPAGLPLVGATGDLVSEMLAKLGVKRKLVKDYIVNVGRKISIDSEVYVTNVINNWLGDSESVGKQYYEKKVRPTPELLAHYDRLEGELSQCSANVLVPMGEHALRAVCGKYGIGKWRGSIIESLRPPGRKCVPMIHPADVLRTFSSKVLCEFDLKRAVEESAFPEIIPPTRNFTIRPNIEQVIQWEERLCKAEYVGFDIETKYNNIACIGLGDNPTDAICIPFIASGANYWQFPQEEARAWQAVNKILRSPAKKIAQNALFDMSHLQCHGIRVENLWFDTMLAQNVLYPEFEKSLAFLTSIYTRQPFYKDRGKAALKYKSEKAWDAKQNDEELWIYNLTDVVVTIEVALKQQAEFNELRAKSSGHSIQPVGGRVDASKIREILAGIGAR